MKVPAMAGEAVWGPTGGKQIRTVANWAIKYTRGCHTDVQGNVIREPMPLEENFEFPSWVPDELGRRFGKSTGPHVKFVWEEF